VLRIFQLMKSNLEYKGKTLHHFFVQSSTTEIAALWAIEVQGLTSKEIQFVQLRGYKAFSKYPIVEPQSQWTATRYWQQFQNPERLRHIVDTLLIKPGDHVYTPQCKLPFIKILYRSMPNISIHLIEEGTANYIYKVDQPPYRNSFRMKRNEITTALIKLLFGQTAFHKFGPGCFFPSYIGSAFLLSEHANIDFPDEKRIVADFENICAKIAPPQHAKRYASAILVLDPLPPSNDGKITVLKNLISYAENEKSSNARLIIKPHPKDDIACISAIIEDLDLELELSLTPIELLNATHDITELFVGLSSTALYAAMLNIPIKRIDATTNNKTLIKQKIDYLISKIANTPPT